MKTHSEAACRSTPNLLLDDPSHGALQKLISSTSPAAFHQLLSTTKRQPEHFFPVKLCDIVSKVITGTVFW